MSFSTKYNPLVSVVIPCYKQAHFLREAMESVFQQTFTDWELIVVNDGSPDNASFVVKQCIGENPRIKNKVTLIEKENEGLAAARNSAIAVARGKYILPLDSDDKLDPNALNVLLTYAKDNTVVVGDLKEFDKSESYYRPGAFNIDFLLYGNRYIYSSLYPKDCFDKIKGYSKGLFGYEDWEFWIRLAAQGVSFHHIPFKTLCYRKHGDSMINDAETKHEWIFAKIVSNNSQLYLDEENLWANWYLNSYSDPNQAVLCKVDILQNNPYEKVYAKIIHFGPGNCYDAQMRIWAYNIIQSNQVFLSNALSQKLSSPVNLHSRKPVEDKAATFEQALRLFEAQEFGLAENELESLLKCEQANSALLHYLALTKYALGKKEDSLIILKKIINDYPEDQKAKENLSILFD
jgi:glycosyltransferase involved in cell wall biosynthesis